MKTFLKRAWAEIHLDRLKDNFTELKKLTDADPALRSLVL